MAEPARLWRRLLAADSYPSVDWNTELGVQLQLDDGKAHDVFVLPRGCVTWCENLLSDFLKDVDAGTELIVPINRSDEDTLELVLEYLCHHYDNGEEDRCLPPQLPIPLPRQLRHILKQEHPWYYPYVYGKLLPEGKDENNTPLMNTVKLADFLKIDSLRRLCCATIACFFWGRSNEQFLDLFGIKQRFTEDDYKRVIEKSRSSTPENPFHPWLAQMIDKAKADCQL